MSTSNDVKYTDGDGASRDRVPPDSIWVTYSTFSGTARINDKGVKIFADDSTRHPGTTRITIPSLSGCGTLYLNFYVSGIYKGTKVVAIRTLDTDSSARVTVADTANACDVNWDGSANAADRDTILSHVDHWKRNALHGILLQRTSFCEACTTGAVYTRGEGALSWSPSQRYITFTSFVPPDTAPACKVFIVPSDPKDGSGLKQFTFTPITKHDYDPSWSPDNTQILFDRGDSVIVRKGVPWASDTSETSVISSSNCGSERGDIIPAISPDGQWVVFSRCNADSGYNLWKIPITGGTATRLTLVNGQTDDYATWSADGQTIYFQRADPTLGPQWRLYQVPSIGGSATAVFEPSASGQDIFEAVQPSTSPDGKVLVFGYGERDDLVPRVTTHTLDPSLSSPASRKVIGNYSDTTFAVKSRSPDYFPVLSPRLSPDGTRLALGSKQVWAARRNMNEPPRITSVLFVGNPPATSINDTTVVYSLAFPAPIGGCFEINATDPEGDAQSWFADALGTNMSFTPSTRQLCWSPSVLGDHYARIRVSDPSSGGSDYLIFKLHGYALDLQAGRERGSVGRPLKVGPNPTRGQFAFPMLVGFEGTVVASVFDVSGRRVAVIRGRGAAGITWDGKARDGSPVPAGIYLYRLEFGRDRREGRVVVVR